MLFSKSISDHFNASISPARQPVYASVLKTSKLVNGAMMK
ncbi:hypothetical protein HMPREF3211_02225 [Staphylococcus aureus]|nr:hypothetical protein HMPREF3211_02225 [Staphylococcus aureus]